jgi:putative membrane protein insertion efficiency factor
MMKLINQLFKPINWLLSSIFLLLIKVYQLFISPLLGPSCRYTPTCSRYAAQAIKKYGPFKGGFMALRRILRCHPWGGHGHDPVP